MNKEDEQIIKDWAELDLDHRMFVLRVRDSNGCKHGAEPETFDSTVRCAPPCDKDFISIGFWVKADASGFTECIGSYKWIATPKFRRLEALLFSVTLETKGQ